MKSGLLTPKANNWTFGFLWFSRRFKARIASFADTDFERIWSHISRLRAMSSVPAGIKSDVALSGFLVSEKSVCGKGQKSLTNSIVYLGSTPYPRSQTWHLRRIMNAGSGGCLLTVNWQIGASLKPLLTKQSVGLCARFEKNKDTIATALYNKSSPSCRDKGNWIAHKHIGLPPYTHLQ